MVKSVKLLRQILKPVLKNVFRSNVNCRGSQIVRAQLRHFGIMDIETAKQKWLLEETELQKALICNSDNIETETRLKYPLRVGGADLSFYKDDFSRAICCYVVLEYLDADEDIPKVVYKTLNEVELSKLFRFHYIIVSCNRLGRECQ